jgi:hypothetical protein
MHRTQRSSDTASLHLRVRCMKFKPPLLHCRSKTVRLCPCEALLNDGIPKAFLQYFRLVQKPF